MENKVCACPFAGCALRGNCEACVAEHRGKTYCRSPKLLQKFMCFVAKIKRE
jgi:hypothetical protein